MFSKRLVYSKTVFVALKFTNVNCVIVRNKAIPYMKKREREKKRKRAGRREEGKKRKTPQVSVDDTSTRHCYMHHLISF